MPKKQIEKEYEAWLIEHVISYFDRRAYSKLLRQLFNTPFHFDNFLDENRVHDALALRHQFAKENGHTTRAINLYLNGPCSVLEIMIGLCIRGEIHIMYDPEYGDRTGLWFANMIESLGLSDQYDENYDSEYVSTVLERFMNHDYKRNGQGGLFTIKSDEHDMRTADIWYQMNWYLVEFLRG